MCDGRRPSALDRSPLRATAALASLLAACASPGPPPSAAGGSLFSFGVVADVQFADKEPAGARHYRTSLDRLRDCVADLQQRDLAFTIQLGDLVDEGPDSFGPVLEAWAALPKDGRHVIGNHDLPLPRERMQELLGLERAYYDFSPADGWRVVVLDGMDLSLHGYGDGAPERAAAAAMLARLREAGAKNAQDWNGGIGPGQLAWLREMLRGADARGERVIVCCHFPVLEKASSAWHLLWNHDEIVSLLAEHRCVVAWLNGHDHAGGHAEHDGVHHVTFAGMVEAPEQNAYAIVDVHDDRLVVRGVGRQRSYDLPLRGRVSWSVRAPR